MSNETKRVSRNSHDIINMATLYDIASFTNERNSYSENPTRRVENKKMCPKQLSEFKNVQRNVQRVGGRKIEFAKIVQQINASGKYWAVTEVYEQLVQKKVGRFRTLKLLNANAGVKKIDCIYDEGKFWFGPKLEK